jgi:TPR repeat protein
MSSPIHHDGDHDPILRYAPPRARAQGQVPTDSSAPPFDQSRRRQSADGAEYSGDRAIVEMRQRLALEPEWIPEPPQDAASGRDLWKVALHASGALGLAALVAWIVVSVPGVTQLGRYVARATFPGTVVSSNTRTSVPPSGVMSTIAASSVATSSIASKAPPEPPLRTVATAEPQAAEAKPRPERQELAVPAPTAGAANMQPQAERQTSPTEHSPAAAREATAAAQRSTPEFVTRQLDRDELTSMLRRADDFIKSGDLSSARLLLRRAAEAGNVQAALTLAGTFDPNVLAALGLQGGAADIAMARLWYERAAQFGSPEAPRRLRQLATNSVQ